MKQNNPQMGVVLPSGVKGENYLLKNGILLLTQFQTGVPRNAPATNARTSDDTSPRVLVMKLPKSARTLVMVSPFKKLT